MSSPPSAQVSEAQNHISIVVALDILQPKADWQVNIGGK